MGTPLPPPQKGEWSPPILGPCLLWPNGWMDESGTNLVLGAEVGFSPGDFVLDGDPAPSLKRGGTPSPIFGPILLWPNGWMHQDATWYGCRPQPGRGLCVRWRPSPLPQKGAEPSNFRPVSIVAKTAGWIKMALGMEVGLGPGHIVLGGVPASAKGA